MFGGILLYRLSPHIIHPLEKIYPISVIYSGNKTPTTTVIKIVEGKRQLFPQLYENIFSTIDHSAQLAVNVIENDLWDKFGELLNINQGLMDAMGLSNERLCDIVYALRKDPGILGSKISGARLGDCVVGLGKITKNSVFDTLPVQMSKEGVKID